MDANTATAIPDGIVVLLPPGPLLETKSAPHTALTATAIHIATIASDAHISVARSCKDQRLLSGIARADGCEMVDISHLLPGATFAHGMSMDIRGHPDGTARKYCRR
jgi:hypothetical protein